MIAVRPRSSAPTAAWAALGVLYLLWGSPFLAVRLALPSIPPLMIGGTRFLVGALLMAALVALVAGPRALLLTRSQLRIVVVSGVLLSAWGNGLVSVALQQTATGLAALLIAAVPLWIVLLRTVTGDRPRPATWVGVAIGLAGLALLVLSAPSGGAAGTLGSAWWGPWLVLLAGAGWAAGTFVASRGGDTAPSSLGGGDPPNPFALAAGQMLVGAVVLSVAALVTGERVDPAAVTATSWWAWAFLAVIVSLGGFGAFAYALAALPVSTVATYAYVNPVVAVLLGVLIVGEHFTAVQLLGGAIVLLAVVVVVAAERPRRAENRGGWKGRRRRPGVGQNCRGVVAASPP